MVDAMDTIIISIMFTWFLSLEEICMFWGTHPKPKLFIAPRQVTSNNKVWN